MRPAMVTGVCHSNRCCDSPDPSPEAHVQQTVGLVKNQGLDAPELLFQPGRLQEVNQAPGCGY